MINIMLITNVDIKKKYLYMICTKEDKIYKRKSML